jgi:hypothetical protein
MIRYSRIAFLLLALAGLSGHGLADKLVLVDGQTLQGELISRSAETVVFAIGGQQLSFPTANVKSIELDMTPQAEEPTVSVAAVPAESGLIVPTGTRLVAKTNEVIDSKRQKQGHRFTAALESALIVDGKTVAPRGAAVYGVLTEVKKSRRAFGSSELVLTFTEILIDEQMVIIETAALQAVTDNTAKNSAGKTARAAAIGGLIDGSSGAKTGAKVGLGASIITSGNSINIPAGSLLETQLTAPLTVQ